jgi:acetyl-CoA C-acetyltransferase
MLKQSTPWNRTPEVMDTTIGWRFANSKLTDKYYPYSMEKTAENVAAQMEDHQGRAGRICVSVAL